MLAHGHSVLGLEQLVNVNSFSTKSSFSLQFLQQRKWKIVFRHRSEFYAKIGRAHVW
jgi:hypothetical protein